MKTNILINAVLILVGFILCFLPAKALGLRICGIIAGFLCIANAASSAYQYLKRDGAKLFSLNLIFALFMTIVGLLLVFYPCLDVNSYSNTLLIFLGIYLIICGLLISNYGVWLLIGKEKSWLICLTTGLMLVIFGVLVMFNPFGKIAVPVVCGLFLIFHSILEITISFLFINRKDEIVEIFW